MTKLKCQIKSKVQMLGIFPACQQAGVLSFDIHLTFELSTVLSSLQESFHLWIVKEGGEGGHRSEYGEWIFFRNYIIGRI